MFSRSLLVALCIVNATPLTPLSTQGDDDCALYLTGPGRSSAYDYSLNLLKGNFAYDGQHTCITYEAINQAYLDARTRILVSQPKGDWKAENFASIGELLLDVSISLARIYGLTYEEIEKGLPLIDTSRTLIREVCPPVFSHVECRAGKYRRLDGLCNNLRHPTWGATMAPFQRLIGPLFADGINAPRISHTGRDLPLSRVVSRTMHPDDGFHDHAGTVMVIAWGQFMDHDYTLTGTPLDPVHRNDPEECCKRPPHLKHPYCNEIRVPDDDYFYRLFGVKCIDFVRGFPSPRPGCRLGSRVPFNTLTGAIDGNTVYGVTEKFARKLRTGYGGLLRMNPVFKEYGLKDLLPLKLDIPDEGCTRPNKNMFCFEAGEIRVNEQLVLTVMHTLMAREHNRVAEALATVNPHWDDETLFQESRRINIAEIQHITYNEFLPILLGKDVMEKFGLVLEKEGYWDGYDQNVNPDVIASFAAAAYRFGHSLLPTAVERWSKAHKFIASKRLSDLIRRPYDLYRAGVLDEYVMGLMNQVAQAMDDSITQEVTNHLFKKVGARFGMDLVSFNMQRGREFGLPGYMEFRKFCGLSGADTFQDLFGSMANETIQKYESIFEHPIDVDLWSGGVSERPLPGSMLGPTFACIIATQFSYSRRGDRFWFELPNQPSSFTPEQIVELRKARLARVICDNTDIIDTVQLYPMVLPDHELNPRVPCRSGIIPSMDFSKWAEPTPFIGGAKEYMTDAHICNQTNQDNKDTTTDRSDDCTINDPSNDFLEQEDCSNDDLVIVANNNDKDKPNKTQKSNTDNKSSVTTNLEENCENLIENSANKLNDQAKNSDTVLKYVYKKIDINGSKKTKGHVKNSLKRKKRSLLSDSEIQAHRQPRKFQINDHQTDREEIAVPQTKPQGIINRDDLADFNIETLHENIKPSINILMKDSKGFVSNQRQNQNTKKYGNDETDVNDRRGKSNNNIKRTASDSDDIPTKYVKKSKNVESDEYDENEKKNVNSKYDSDSINNDYIDESISVENNSNEYIENGNETLPQEVEDGSSDYNIKNNRNIKSDSFNKDGRHNDYTKEFKNYNNDSNDDDVKDTRNTKGDSFNKDDRRNEYTKESKNDNNDSNEFDVKDTRNIKGDSFNKDGRRNDYTKESKNNNDDSNEYDVKDTRNIKSDSFNKDGRRNDYTKKSKNDNNDSNEYDVKDTRNIKSDFFNKDGRRNDYTKESKNDNDDSNEYDVKDTRNIKSDSFNKDGRRNDYTKESKNDNNDSNQYDVKDTRNIKRDFFNKDGRRNDYTKESKNDNNENNEYDVKDTRNIKSDSFNKDGRRNDYTKKSKNDNNDSNEYDVKDTRNIKSDFFNKDGRRNDYTKESKNDNDDSNEYDVKDTRNIKSDSFNKDGRRNDYTKESKNDNNDSNQYDVKDTRNIKRDFFNKDGRRNDYTKESKNDNNENNEYDVKDSRKIKSASFDKNDRSNDYTKESKNDNNESNEYDVKDSRNIKNASFDKKYRNIDYIKESQNDNNKSNEYDIKDSRNINNAPFNKGDRRNNYTKETKNVNNERNEFEGKDRKNIKSLNYENRKRNKQYSNIDEGSKARHEDYLTDFKDTLKSDEILDADFLEKSVPTPRNHLSDKNLEELKKQHTNNNSEIVNHEDLKETSYESNEKVNDLEETKLLDKDNEEIFTANKKRNNSINLQEDDLDDFSYESIEDSKDQSNAHIINFNKNNDRSTLSENVALIPNTLEKPFTGRNSKKPPLIKTANKNEKQIKINDDEIKPVKELNYSESQREEESKEYKESEKSEDKELSMNDRLKSVIEKSHKLHPNSKAEKENTDLKAQFERIPENYIHTDVKSNSTEKKPLIENSGEEGTLDSFSPNNYEYDKDLNIKFNDLTIKLPEIKLPKDILAYAREETKNHKEDYDNSEDKEKDNSGDKEKDNSEDKEKDNSEDHEKDNSRDKENEEEQEEDEVLEDYINKPKIHRNHKQNGEDFYQSYFNPSVDLSNPQEKEKYSNFHNEDSGEDLYEKFVRERFGKRNDLKKRSEKLIDYHPVAKNYKLYKTVRKALKRANKIEKEAEKSKDPNYMWTLEYGGKL